MRKALLILAGFMLIVNVLHSQDSKYSAAEVYPLGVGLFVAGKASVNTLDSPDGVKNGYVFNSIPDLGLQVYVPFGTENNLGATIDFAYLNHQYMFKLYGNEDVNWRDELAFFTISPNIHISGFFIGMNFGFPLAAKSGNENDENDYYNYDYDKDNLNGLIDFHLGGLIPVYADEFGRLNLYIQAEYTMNKLFSKDLQTKHLTDNTQNFNIQPAGLKFGLSYIINTGLMQK